MTASRTCCHVRPPSIAIWMLVTTSLASAPMMAAPRMRSVRASMMTLKKPSVRPRVLARGTAAVGVLATRTS